MFDFLDPEIIVKSLGLLGVVLIIFAESGLFFGFFLPGDSLLFTAGLLASQGYINIFYLIIFCFIAAVLGDNVGYAFGKKVGPAIFTKEDSFFFNKKRIEDAEKFYEKHGRNTIILARFFPFVRTFAPILAGVGRMDYKTFLIFNALGALIWAVGIPIIAYTLGSTIPGIEKFIVPIVILILLTSLIPAGIHLWKEKKSKNKI